MIHDILLRRLDELAARYRQLRMWQGLSLVWLAGTITAGLLWAGGSHSTASPQTSMGIIGTVAILLAGVAVWLGFRSARNYSWLAQQVEMAFPELRTCLLAAVEQRPELPGGEFGYLQTSVMWQALDHARRHPWVEIVPARRLFTAMTSCLIAFTLFVGTLAGTTLTASPLSVPGGSLAAEQKITAPEVLMTVEPGDVEIERGTSLLVLARIQGPMPAEATLIYKLADGNETSATMPASLEDPVFSGRISRIEQSLEYQVSLASQSSPRYRVTVFEYPRLERADAQLVYPSYTGLEERLIQDVRTVSVVEGTQLTLRCYLNKPVASAKLTNAKSDAPGDDIILSASAAEPLLYEATIDCQQSRRLKLELRDDRGRKEQKVEQFSIHVLPNQPPSIKPTFPARDLEVSALEELDVKAAVTDDFGVRRIGVSYSLAGQPPVDVVVSENGAAKQKHEVVHKVALEELQAEPDQLLSYYWWAEDLDAQGQTRRTNSDMYFAEVRPFEEIFRQGEQPPGGQQQQKQQGQGQNAQDAQELAKLQKDIINATWKVLRRESVGPLTPAFAEDVNQVRLAQESAIEKAAGLAERLQDEKSQGYMEEVLKQMQSAVDQLKLAGTGPSRDPLTPALSAEQAAYQGLLKLRAREHEVVRQQQSQQGSQSSSRSQQQQQQMQQLDLQKQENRYETQRTAEEQKQESAEDRENRQVLNRLRELARRQHDLNERLKELQAALEEAQTAEEKEEIRRQLQRLQDEQRQILQDTDELQSRLSEAQNQERMQQERQRLDETRDQVRRASEALEQQRVGQAAAAGTRAEQQFEELREEFRRRASNRFQQEMQEMRETARELEQKEQEVAEQIRSAAEPKPASPKLQDEDNRGQISEKVAEQRTRLTNLQDQMRDTIERAETTEPILSQRLYDTARNLRDQSIDKALQNADRSLRQGQNEEAQKQEAVAGEGVRQIREGIERAAEGVLGDETESLRRARDELKELSRELNEELQRNAPAEKESGDKGKESGDRSSESGQKQPGQQGEGNQQQSGQQAGQPSKNPGTSGEQPGKQPRQSGKQPGKQGQQEQQGQGEQPGQGQQPSEGQQPNQGVQPGKQGEQSAQGQRPGQGEKPGQQGQQPGQGNQPDGSQQSGQRSQRNSGTPSGAGATGPHEDYVPGDAAPLTGERFREWSDRLRDVEEMVDDTKLRGDAARIRERARAIRLEFKRHSKEPNWDIVRDDLSRPLNELQQRVSEELLRRTSKKALVPLDRDPVPPQYSEKSRRYYEQLGSGKQ